MKKFTVFISLLTAFLIFSADSLACTSFAVYSEKTYYGMNFDHYIYDIRFSIDNDTKGDTKIFSMDFLINGKYYPTVSMNNKGLFSSCQLAYPQKGTVNRESEKQMDMFDLFYDAPYITDKVKDIREIVKEKTMICEHNFVHNLFADSSKDATVVETNNKENWITNIEGRSIIMTNFFNSELKDGDIASVTGLGSDRYIKAKDYIDAHIKAFSYDDGMAVLKKTAQANSMFPTQCSMLFYPAEAEVYIVMNRDFTKVWKASINEGTVETYKGFKDYQSVKIGNNGLLSAELSNIGVYSGVDSAAGTVKQSDISTLNNEAQSNRSDSDRAVMIAAVVCTIVLVSAATLVVFILRAKKAKHI